MKKTLSQIFIAFLLIIIYFSTSNNSASALISEYLISGNHSNKISLDYIDSEQKSLFVGTDKGLYIINPETFLIENELKTKGDILDFHVIKNKDAKSNIIIFLADENQPSVICFSLETFKELWSFTSYIEGYDNSGVKVRKKLPVFDYDLTEDRLLVVTGYTVYDLDIKTGKENWHYKHHDNIWSVSLINDINADLIQDVVISVQPTNVLALNGKNGQIIWSKEVAQTIEVSVDNKVVGKIKTNIWQLDFVDNQIIATSEDGNVYALNPSNGNIERERQVLANIPNKIMFQSYFDGANLRDMSSLNGTYKILNTRIIKDINNDDINDLLVTTFETNHYTSYDEKAVITLLDGKNLNTIGKLELNENKLLNVSVSDDLSVFLYDGKKIIYFNAKDYNNTYEIYPSLENITQIYYDEYLYIYNQELYQVDVSNPLEIDLINIISFFEGYDSVIYDNLIYKFYYQYDKYDRHFKNYYAVSCETINEEILWSYDLLDAYFRYYDFIEDKFIYIDNNNRLVIIENGDIIAEKVFNENVKFITKVNDFNDDGQFDLLVLFHHNEFLIINFNNLEDIIFNNYLYYLFEYEHYDFIYPIFNQDKNQMYLFNNKSITIINFDDSFNVSKEDIIDLENYNFWFDPWNIKLGKDYDDDGINDLVIRISDDRDHYAVILYSSEANVGFIKANWDYTIYPLNEDLNGDDKFDVLISTSGDDENGVWHTKFQIVNPYSKLNETEIIFEKRFYEGNELTYNTKLKPLTIVDDFTKKGSKNVLVLVDRWGDIYLQVYDLDNDKLIKDVIPLYTNYINEDEMRNASFGSPGAFIDTFTFNSENTLILSFISQGQVSTKLFDLDSFRLTGSLNKRLYDYYIVDDKIIYQVYLNRNEEMSLEFSDLNQDKLKLNIDENMIYDTVYFNLKWDKSRDVAYYKVYLNGKLVEITVNNEISLSLNNGKNLIGIGEVLANGIEEISYFTIKTNPSNNDFIYYLITGSLIVFIFILPLSKTKYQRRKIDE